MSSYYLGVLFIAKGNFVALLLNFTQVAMTTVSQDVQTRSSVQLAFAKFLSKIKGNF